MFNRGPNLLGIQGLGEATLVPELSRGYPHRYNKIKLTRLRLPQTLYDAFLVVGSLSNMARTYGPLPLYVARQLLGHVRSKKFLGAISPTRRGKEAFINFAWVNPLIAGLPSFDLCTCPSEFPQGGFPLENSANTHPPRLYGRPAAGVTSLRDTQDTDSNNDQPSVPDAESGTARLGNLESCR